MLIQCEILKAGREGAQQDHYDSYSVEAASNDTVLDVLMSVYQKYDPDLAFRFACGVARCGECGLLVNGHPCLACDRIVEEKIRIEPLYHLPIVKDTVVNRRHVFEQIQRILPKPETQPDFPEVMASVDEAEGHNLIENSVRMTTCFECMICESCCPRYQFGSDMFAGPLGLLFLAQRQQNPAAVPASEEDIARTTAYCARCGKCLKYCPAESKPLPLALSLLGCKLSPYLRVSIDDHGQYVIERQIADL